MSRLKDKIALVTGASSGIGEACAIALAREGCHVIITGRRQNRLAELSKTISRLNRNSLILAMDIQVKAQVEQAITSLSKDWKNIDILLNNAGLARGLNKLQEGNIADWESMINTNVKGLLYMTRYIVPGMIKRGHGDIINIGSIAGHETYPNGNIYCATKHAVNAITKSLRMDLVETPLRVATVDPGLVETEFSKVRFKGDEGRAKAVYRGIEPLVAEDIAEAVLFILTRPAHVQIGQIIIFPTNQASTMVVHRKEV